MHLVVSRLAGESALYYFAPYRAVLLAYGERQPFWSSDQHDAIAGVENYEGLASGPISFCADPTPQCRDGNRTPVLIAYTEGGENFETEILARVTMPIDFGLEHASRI